MKLKTKIKLLSGLLVTVVISVSAFIVIYGSNKDENSIKIIETNDKYKTTIQSKQEIIESVKKELTGKLIIQENETKVNHTTEYTEEIPVNMYGETIKAKATVKKSGTATVIYNYIINLDKTVIEENGDTVYIKVNKPYLNEKSVKVKNNCFILDEDNSSISFAGRMKISQDALNSKTSETLDGKAGRQLMNEIPNEAIKQIKKQEKDLLLEEQALALINEKLNKIINYSNTDQRILLKYK